MFKKRFYIGGEYFYSPMIWLKNQQTDLDKYLDTRFPGKEKSFFFGGYSALSAIIQNIDTQNDQHVLLPSYLCPTILYPFKEQKVAFRFYKVGKDLTVDINDLSEKVGPKTKAVFFIDYFGFPQNEKFYDLLEELKKEKKIIVIQDSVQSFMSGIQVAGNYAFNSFRKFFPADGSFVLSDHKLEVTICDENTKYIEHKRKGQFNRYLYNNLGIGKPEKFLQEFGKAETNYYENKIVGFNTKSRTLLEKYSFEDVGLKRRNNFKYLLNNFTGKKIYESLNEEIVPLGFPIIIEDRDKIRRYLIDNNIFCPVHWKLSDDICKKEFEESWYLSEHIMTIPVNEMITIAHYNKFFEIWNAKN